MAKVCKLVQDYADKEARREYFDMVQAGDLSPERAAERLHMTLSLFLDEMQTEGYEVPETMQVIRDARNGIGLSRPYSNIDDFLKDLED